MDHSSFIAEAWSQLARALSKTAAKAGLNHYPTLMSRCARGRCMRELRRLAVLIRRLIFLMALTLELAPAAPREGRNYFRAEEAKPRRCKPYFRITPVPAGALPELCRSVTVASRSGKVDAIPVLVRWMGLLDVVTHRERRAKCLARTIQRWQAKGEPKPHVAPTAHTHRFSAQLGLIAMALPMLLNTALQAWPDTG
ncbi:MAG: hypothetical protein R3C04_08755 [Hyphomonas sp.]